MAELMEEVLSSAASMRARWTSIRRPLDLRALPTDRGRGAFRDERRCPIELRAECDPRRAQADERLLRHIFIEPADQRGEIFASRARRWISASSAMAADCVCRVRDHGIGIPEEDRERLFNAFHRGTNVGTSPGTGLGLVIVKRCVDLHGGRSSPQRTGRRHHRSPSVSRRSRSRMKKILVIEDEPEMRRNLATILSWKASTPSAPRTDALAWNWRAGRAARPDPLRRDDAGAGRPRRAAGAARGAGDGAHPVHLPHRERRKARRARRHESRRRRLPDQPVAKATCSPRFPPGSTRRRTIDQ